MKCQICGRENELNSNFCVSCGNKLLNENNYINPTKKQEMILKIVNFILITICTILAYMIVYVKVILELRALTSGDSRNYAIPNYNINIAIIFFIILSITVFVFNRVMGISMYEKNKNNIYIGKYKPVKKVTYLSVVWFLGMYGVHRFIIGDKKGGIARLFITFGIPLFITIFLEVFSGSTTSIIPFYSTWLCIMISFSLLLSDYVIGLSKVSDNNKKISL